MVDEVVIPVRPLPRVLVVEDEPRMRELLLKALPDMGFPVEAARTGEQALRIMQDDPREIVMLDLNLPGIQGMQLLEQLRADGQSFQAIIMTGFGDLASAQQAIRLDAVDFLTKPTPLNELEKALDRARRRIWEAYQQQLRHLREQSPEPVSAGSTVFASEQEPEPVTLEAMERRHILQSLQQNGGNRTLTAEKLGISRRMLQYRLAQYQREGHLTE